MPVGVSDAQQIALIQKLGYKGLQYRIISTKLRTRQNYRYVSDDFIRKTTLTNTIKSILAFGIDSKNF